VTVNNEPISQIRLSKLNIAAVLEHMTEEVFMGV
jgi:hypothetical protein